MKTKLLAILLTMPLYVCASQKEVQTNDEDGYVVLSIDQQETKVAPGTVARALYNLHKRRIKKLEAQTAQWVTAYELVNAENEFLRKSSQMLQDLNKEQSASIDSFALQALEIRKKAQQVMGQVTVKFKEMEQQLAVVTKERDETRNELAQITEILTSAITGK